MSHRSAWLPASRPFLLLLLSLVFLPGSVLPSSEGYIRRFNFSPDAAPGFKGFTQVSAAADYSPQRGFGWRDAGGGFQQGRWKAAASSSWEARQRLNLICRTAPDDLARSFFAGPAAFVVDLEPGRYEVWLLTGDAGFKEYSPHAPFQVAVNGTEACRFSIPMDEFYLRFENPDLDDDLDAESVWHRHVAPRFTWSKAAVDVRGAPLVVDVHGGSRDTGYQELVGDYAITELRGGPPRRFAGAVSALVVVREGSADGTALIREIDAQRFENFSSRWPLEEIACRTRAAFTARDRRRGFTLFFPALTDPVNPDSRATHTDKPIRVRAALGEYAAFTFALGPIRDLGRTVVEIPELLDSVEGGKAVMEIRGSLAAGVVRYAARAVDPEKGGAWRPAPAMIVPAEGCDIREGVARQFWLTLRVPEAAVPGVYTGRVRVAPERGEPVEIPLDVEVLPFKLSRPRHLSVGMTYFSPVPYAFFDEERFWERMQAEFRDMRAHNLTCVQFTGIRMDDYERMGRAFSLYREAGFENPLYLLESYGAMLQLQREGFAWNTDAFPARYSDFIRRFLDEGKKRGWPAVVINFGDEFTNSGIEEFGAEVARNLRRIPGIVTGADVNGFKEAALLAPLVDILAFNHGWDGPQGVNRGKRLLNRATVEMVSKAGATPWLVNVGIDRFSNGFWLWKMSKQGVRGKMEWIYRGYNGMPFDNFDAEPLAGHIAYPGPAGGVIPSLEYEWMRIGLDDLAYLHTLEERIEAGRGLPSRRAAVAAAEAFIEKLAAEISDDMSVYLDRQGKVKAPWPAGRFDALRSQVADLILALQK
jgi:hypothetical protein